MGFGDVATRAAALPVPTDPPLRPAQPLATTRVDLPDKVAGRARFGIDVERPGLLHAAVRHAPRLGARRVAWQREAALARPGVRAVLDVPDGVVVVADHFWQAQRALDALAPEFAGHVPFDSHEYAAALDAALDEPGWVAADTGDASARLRGAPELVEARYRVPFVAHATMEPMNATAEVRGDTCEMWAPTQSPTALANAVADALGLARARVRTHTTLLGGGFGRRYEVDFGVEAALASRAVGRPVKLVWSREEDLRHDFYRPAFASRLRCSLDREGLPEAWLHRVSGPWLEAQHASPWWRAGVAALQRRVGSIVPPQTPDALEYRIPGWVRRGGSGAALAGADPRPYAARDVRVEWRMVDCPAPLGYWRSVGHSQNAFFLESFVDEVAHHAGRDPLAQRRAMLADEPRALAVLERAAEHAGWEAGRRAGRALGLAYHHAFGSHVALVVELASTAGGAQRVERMTCAVDCGVTVCPDIVAAQIEGGALFGLEAALHGEITFRDGAVVEGNFDRQPLLRLSETPEIEVVPVASDAPPGGVGEAGTPPVAPAVANALHAATGVRVRALPLVRSAAWRGGVG